MMTGRPLQAVFAAVALVTVAGVSVAIGLGRTAEPTVVLQNAVEDLSLRPAVGSRLIAIDAAFCLGCNNVGYHLRHLPDSIAESLCAVVVVGSPSGSQAAVAALIRERIGVAVVVVPPKPDARLVVPDSAVALWERTGAGWEISWRGTNLDGLGGKETSVPTMGMLAVAGDSNTQQRSKRCV